MTKVFISWSGDQAKSLAEGLKETVFSFPGINSFLSSIDIEGGDPWREELKQNLDDATSAIACITPGISRKPWVNFEVGFLAGKLNNCKLISFREPPLGPLTLLQHYNASNQEHLIRLLHEVAKCEAEKAKEWIEFKWEKWKERLSKLERFYDEERSDLEQIHQYIDEELDRVKASKHFKANRCFSQVIIQSLADVGEQIEKINDSYSVPASQYPHYLIELQRRFKAKVNALALVDREEKFWQEKAGRAICSTTNPDSTRIFVFLSPEHLVRNYETLKLHAHKYNVFALSHDHLVVKFDEYTKDFSIIETLENKILAVYEDAKQKNIRFSCSAAEIRNHETNLDRIKTMATRIPSVVPDVEEVVKHTFYSPGLTPVLQKPIEMSAYISIDDYDAHEENHAYYREMMERMLHIFKQGRKAEHNRILELGAGTGIFTKRLADLEDVNVVAIELDWVCFKKLITNIRSLQGTELVEAENDRCVLARTKNRTTIELHNKDSRTFNPPGKFNFIFSSFADHHIKTRDKKTYFANIKQNLEPGGLLIVGDEYLRSYDPEAIDSRVAALVAYHGHIIDLAVSQEEHILADLERAALNSGLEARGDFKVSCKEYEAALGGNGFDFRSEKIGPKDTEDIGGVYMYTAWQKSG